MTQPKKKTTDPSVLLLFQEYKTKGVEKGFELLLPPDIALELIDRLELLNVGIYGMFAWFITNGDFHRAGIVQDEEIDMVIPTEVLDGRNWAKRSLELGREYIRKGIKQNTKYVSIVV